MKQYIAQLQAWILQIVIARKLEGLLVKLLTLEARCV